MDNILYSIKDSLYNSLIYQERYKYILEGLKSTIIMAFFATIIGTILGILIAVVEDNYEKNNDRWNELSTLCCTCKRSFRRIRSYFN